MQDETNYDDFRTKDDLVGSMTPNYFVFQLNDMDQAILMPIDGYHQFRPSFEHIDHSIEEAQRYSKKKLGVKEE